MSEPKRTVKPKEPERELGGKFSMQIYRMDEPLVEALAKKRDRSFTRVCRDLMHEALQWKKGSELPE